MAKEIKKAKQYMLALLLAVLLPLTAMAQGASSKVVTGTVVDDNNEPLIGVSVTLKNTKTAVVTDAEGRFSVPMQKDKDVLVFSYVGMSNQEVRVQAGKRVTVRMQEDEHMLKETVVNGVYTRNIETFTGSVSTFSGDELKMIAPQGIIKSLSALDPSFIITEDVNLGSNPNALADISINGKMNVKALSQEYETNPNQPLFILDGFESSLQTISDLNMDRVESISILKDASATAIYGSKAANGVIVVETKKPKAGRLNVNYNGSLTVAWADLSDFNLMDASEKLEFELISGVYKTDVTAGSGVYVYQGPDGLPLSEAQRKRYFDKLRMVKEGQNSYWMNEPLRTAATYAHNLAIQGGDATFRYGVNLSYNKTQGVMKGSDRDVLNGNINLIYRVDNFSFTNRTTISNTKNDNETVSFSRFSRMNPFYAKYTEDGEVAKYVYYDSDSRSYIWNPIWDMNQNSYNQGDQLQFTNDFQMDWRILSELRLRGNFQIGTTRGETSVFVSPNETSQANKDVLKRGSFTETNQKQTRYNGRINLTYGKTFGVHTVNAAAGMQFSESNSMRYGFKVEGYQTDQFSNPNMSNGYAEGSKPTSSDSKSRSVSYYGNFNYSYDMRYLLDFNITNSGASQFGISDPFSTTWAIGAGWNVHNEKWFKQSDVINYLKVRYSYGNPGNQNYDAKLSSSIYSYVTDKSNPFGMAALVSTWGNIGLKWQKTQTHNIGVNASMFKNRLNLSFDYQTRKNSPMLVRIDMPTSTGVNQAPMNVGATSNKSVSGSVTYYIIRNKDMNWYVNLNASHNTTKYYNIGNSLEIYNEQGRASQSLLRMYDGASTTGLYCVRSAGIDPATGNEIFIRKDGSLTYEWNIDDEVLYGDTNPDVSGNINTSFVYKDFTFGASFAYRLGAEVQLNTLLNKVENVGDLNYNQDRRALSERWKKPGDISKYKRITDTMTTNMSSRFVKTENTLQCTSINIGYRTTTAPFLNAIHATSFNVTAYMNDIFRISTVKEERGIDYPFQRSFSLSVGVGF